MGFVVFSKKYKIENNDFITILGSLNVKNMVPTTIHRPNLIENVLRGSIDHTETLWTLSITSILLVSSGDLILTSKNRLITILDVFVGGSLHKVARIGLEIIGLRFVCTKYIIFLMSHTRHVSASNSTIG